MGLHFEPRGAACDESTVYCCVHAGVKGVLIVYEFLGRKIWLRFRSDVSVPSFLLMTHGENRDLFSVESVPHDVPVVPEVDDPLSELNF